jgi:hypothetical protein
MPQPLKKSLTPDDARHARTILDALTEFGQWLDNMDEANPFPNLEQASGQPNEGSCPDAEP